MRTFVFEGVQDIGIPLNWGKFMVGVPDMEWSLRSEVDPDTPFPLLQQIGWTPEHIWAFDLQTGEAAIFNPHGNARADLEKHRIWVCPLFEMFLTWLYKQNIEALHLLPRIIELPDAQFSINGYRRLGPHDVSFTLGKGDVFTIEWADEPRTVICEDVTDEGAIIRSLTAEETFRLEEMLRAEEPEITTVTFTFPSGSQVTVAPDGQVVGSPDDLAALEAAPDPAATAEMLKAATDETADITLADEDTAFIGPLPEMADGPPRAAAKPPGKPAKEK